jgi:branched-chain amino acid transport system ATP-binding protein
MAAAALLELDKLEVAYGGIHAVKGIDLIVRQGELVCLIGANGAGKTTTLKGITGLQPVKSGKVVYDSEDVTGKPAFELVRKGLSMVPEGRGVFGALTIEENLAMGAYSRSDRNEIRQDVERVFGLFPRLKERR